MKKLLVFFLLLSLSVYSSNDVNKLKNQTKTIDSNIKKNQANITKAKKLLNWEAELTIEDMCRDSWNWQKKNPNGFEK